MKKRLYKRLSKKEIEQHLKTQSNSNLSIKAYCQKHALVYATFMFWRQSKKGKQPAFIQVPIPNMTTSSIEILLPNGIQAKLSPNHKSEDHMLLLKSLMEISHA